MLNIPIHKGCRNCGECCGMVPVNLQEKDRISKYLKDNPEIRKNINKNIDEFDINCKFRNDKDKRCMIYPVRPTICMLMGVSKELHCKYGNSYEIDGKRLLHLDDIEDMTFLNSI